MEPKDISCMSSSGFKSRWKARRAVCIQLKTMVRGRGGVRHGSGSSRGAGFSRSSRWLFSWQCLINNQCSMMLVGFRLSGMHWIIWVVWAHVVYLPSEMILCYFVHSAKGKVGLLFSVFRMRLCKVVSELMGWNWELLWSWVSIRAFEKWKWGSHSSFHGFITNTN